jgi:hypothetical protein
MKSATLLETLGSLGRFLVLVSNSIQVQPESADMSAIASAVEDIAQTVHRNSAAAGQSVMGPTRWKARLSTYEGRLKDVVFRGNTIRVRVEDAAGTRLTGEQPGTDVERVQKWSVPLSPVVARKPAQWVGIRCSVVLRRVSSLVTWR